VILHLYAVTRTQLEILGIYLMNFGLGRIDPGRRRRFGRSAGLEFRGFCNASEAKRRTGFPGVTAVLRGKHGHKQQEN